MAQELVKIAVFFVCIFFSAFFSGSEVALISITQAKVRALLKTREKNAAALAALRKEPDHILITVLIGNNLVNVAAAAVATSMAIDRFGDAGVGIATGLVVLVLLIFGEIGPKMLAVRFTEPVALAVSRPILLLSRIFSPVLWAFDHVSRSRTLTAAFAKPAITEEEIRGWIDLGKEEGTIEKEEQEMLYNVLAFGDTTAREVMTPRLDVVMVEDTATLRDAARVFDETGFSRLPVFHDQKDNVTGLLNIKDVFPAVLADRKDQGIRDLATEPYFVPESKKIDEILKELQRRKVHMAMVLDEYGVFAGILTVEDILEELVGDIMDEFDDQEEPGIQQMEEGVYFVHGHVWVEELNAQLGTNLPVEESFETLGGLIIDRLGHIPHKGEMVAVTEAGVRLVVLQMWGRRIRKVKVILPRHGSTGQGSGGGEESG
ncbi:MAG: hemolysin family protein [Methanomicrobiales archaeon]|nr:hemolysin family protein [Methanomicrobiales archaeon]MDD1659951.1 hemolysin family protein [Methanomicrobiales archaeon]